ncbi:hypothetical protein TEA_010564 [Camellia sinensis var. sinensis]|uniref:Glutamate--cysteine ligase n=1 Tax=Camellia sinensis var. sinensis TaxID=542762 RepID=A0A4S4EJ04_CAMSN|nr:hypothetical protein TEA_010564 [Camellia sinensis var. sinensis]
MKETCTSFLSLPSNSTKTMQSLHLDSSGVWYKRGHWAIVNAAPPTEDAVIATKPLTKEDLVQHHASGCKTKENWRTGTEHEKIGFEFETLRLMTYEQTTELLNGIAERFDWDRIMEGDNIIGLKQVDTLLSCTEHEKIGFEFETLRPMTYEQTTELLNGIAERFDWDRIMEGDNIIGLKQGMQNISLEPGGQFELSGAPLETLHQTCAEVKAVAEEMGIGFLGIGLQPKWGLKDTPIMPKGRYEILRNYLPKVGSLGLDVMFQTCTVQVNLDFSSEVDVIRKFRASLALQPIATALFANSPFTEGKPNGYLSMRSQVWTDVDNARTGMIPFVFDDYFGFEQYVDYALDVPMWFVYRKKKYIDCSGLSFRDFMAGLLLFQVRLKRYLEMRGADVGPRWSLHALPAFWVPKSGLKTPFRDGLLKHVAEDVVRFAKDGLERRGFKEIGFLNEVAEVVRTGSSSESYVNNDEPYISIACVTPAEKLLELYHGKWGGSVDPVFEELQY